MPAGRLEAGLRQPVRRMGASQTRACALIGLPLPLSRKVAFLKLVLFDCDGTLVDSQVMIVTAMTRAFAAVGLAPPPREAVLGIVGLSLPIAVARLLGPAVTVPVGTVVEAYKAAFFELRQSPEHREPLFPFARDVLDDLSARDDLLMGIVTGKSRRGVDAILAMHGLARHFQVIRTADDAPSKPDPTMVLDAIAEVGGTAGRTVVIGDTTFDAEMARAAGCTAIGVAWGYHPPETLVEAGAMTVAADFRALGAALDQLLAVWEAEDA